MKITSIIFIGCFIVLLLASCTDSVESPPYELGPRETGPIERTLWKVLGKESHTEFTDDELATVTHLKVTDRGGTWLIQSELTLLARCINLTEFEMNVQVPGLDLSPLGRLQKLTKLTLGGISDLSPLVSLINLTDLKLTRNNLTVLHPLMGLVNLQKLNLQHNNIVNLRPLTALVNLQELNLQFNRIVDLKPLADNSGLSQGDIVMVERNPLSKMSRDQHIPALEARGVIIRW